MFVDGGGNLIRIIVTVLAACIGFGVVACNEEPSAPAQPNIAAFVTGAAAAALQPDGTFKLASLPQGSITPAQARALSTAYVHDAGIFLAAAWEYDRGGRAVDYAHLVACGRTFFAKGPYETLPVSAGTALQQDYGDFFLTTLCTPAGEPEVSIGVPALDTALHVAADGSIIGINSANFASSGVRPGIPFPPSPEAVVQQVAQQTGRRVIQVPELVTPPRPYLPQLAKWRIQLESPMDFQEIGDSTRLSLSEVYFGYGSSANSKGLQRGRRCAPTQFKVPIFQVPGDSVTVSLADGYDNCYTRIDSVGQRTAHLPN